MNIESHPLEQGQWYPQPTNKKLVVWHGTGGRTRDTPVSPRPAGLGHDVNRRLEPRRRAGRRAVRRRRDGTIYQTFDDAQWIYHLGLERTNGACDKAPVAIELANELGLSLDGDRLHAFRMNTPHTIYTGSFLSYQWRGYHHFAQLDEAQVDAGIELTLDICRRHNIDPVFFCPSTSFDYAPCFQVATIVCHSNCHAEKTDLCLAECEAAGIRMQS